MLETMGSGVVNPGFDAPKISRVEEAWQQLETESARLPRPGVDTLRNYGAVALCEVKVGWAVAGNFIGKIIHANSLAQYL